MEKWALWKGLKVEFHLLTISNKGLTFTLSPSVVVRLSLIVVQLS